MPALWTMHGHEESQWHVQGHYCRTDTLLKVLGVCLEMLVPWRLLVATHGPQCQHLTCRGVPLGVFARLL